MTSVVVQRTAEKKKKKTIFVVANLFIFIFIFRDVKRNYCFSLHVGWIGCRMDSLPAALVVWMAVLPDAGPAYFLLLSGEGSVAGLACSKSMDGWEAEGGGTAGTPGPRLLVPGQLYPVACQETGYRQRGCQDP